MRAAIDARCLTDHFPGIGRYTFELVRALARIGDGHEWLVICDSISPNARFDIGELARLPGVRLVRGPLSAFNWRAQYVLPRVFSRFGAQVYWSPYYIRPFFTPMPPVVTLHDIIPLLAEGQASHAARLKFDIATRITIRTASGLVAVSGASARDFARAYGVSESRITVIPHGVDERFAPCGSAEQAVVRGKYALPERFLLYVGSNKPHKNLSFLVKCFSRARVEDILAIAGASEPTTVQDDGADVDAGSGKRVRWLGRVADEDLPALYSAATAFVFPSLYEGFGLPVLEAMACGTAVLCSNASSLPEVAGEAALLADPRNEVDWVMGIERILGDDALRAELSEKGRMRARGYTWDKAAASTLGVLESVVASSKKGSV